MAAQFGRAPLASLPAPALGTSAASARPLLQAPHNVRLDGMLRRFFEGTQVPYPSSVGRRYPFTMAEDVAGAVLFFVAAQGLLEIMIVENGGPYPVEPGEALSMTVAPETFGVTV